MPKTRISKKKTHPKRIQHVFLAIIVFFAVAGTTVVATNLLFEYLDNTEGEESIVESDGQDASKDDELGDVSGGEDGSDSQVNGTESDRSIDVYLPETNTEVDPPSNGSGQGDIEGDGESTSLSWGAYTGWLVSEAEKFQQNVGAEMDYLAVFVHWGNESEFPVDMAQYAKSKNMTLVIYWEAMDYNVSSPIDPRFSYDAIIRGDWDPYILGFAESVRSFGGPVIIVPFEEMNSDWYPWSGMVNGNNSTKHILAYRHVRDMFRYAGNASFGWAVNNVSVPDTQLNARLNYYPGDNYVDYVGVDGFNFGDPWQTFSQTFDEALVDVSTLGKPVIIFSMACSSGPQKDEWIRDALQVGISSYDGVVGWIWFNEDKEEDWRVWSTDESLQAFQESVAE
jgi:hypothetical protein